jgi:P-type Cu+ transporter
MSSARDRGSNDAAPELRKSSSTTELEVRGMNCANCAQRVTEALKSVPGVGQVAVRLETARASVSWTPGAERDMKALLEGLRAAGYPARELSAEGEAAPAAGSVLAVWRFNVSLGAFLTVPLMIGEWVFGLGETLWFQWVGFAFATPVMWVCGRQFFVGAWRQLKRGASNMDTLVSLGSSAAYLFSTAGLWLGFPGHLYFMEAAAILTLISAGHWLEALMGARASRALESLMTLAPATARKRLQDQEVEVLVTSLQPDDLVVLRPGDRVPVDGEVIEGESVLDESMLTGESMPVEKVSGARVYGGTLNQQGRLLVRVTAVGAATALAQIIEVVQRAQNSRANIQRLADRVSSVFVPVVVGIAMLTALFWGLAPELARSAAGMVQPFLWPAHLPQTALAAAIIHATAVLIVACPCAMGLATPAAIMAGTNVAARRGILIRDGHALEKSGRLTAVVFDKTGTLTLGHVAVVAEAGFGLRGGDLALARLAFALAQPSQHPISRAVTDWARRAGPDVVEAMVGPWQERPGEGIVAELEGGVTRLGSLRWLSELGVDLGPGAGFRDQWISAGATVVGLARDLRLVGLFAVRDVLKPNAAAVVEHLTGRGLQVFLLSGDVRTTALAMAREAGISESRVMAEVRPGQKAAAIEALQRAGERVAFVGDGINDAPALEQSDLGIAVAKASDVAREAADMILLSSDLEAIPESIELAQATLRTIRQNLFWAFFYNTAAIPLAALGFLSPVVCALAMGMSDLLVIGNALRLNRRARR